MADSLIEYKWMPEPVVVANEYELMALRFNERSAVMHAALQVVLSNVEQHFQDEGPGWAPWAESYVDQAEVENEGILTKTGALREGATSEGSYEVNREFIIWTGAASPDYWKFHAFGTSKMPQRNFIGLDVSGEEQIVVLFDKWMGTL